MRWTHSRTDSPDAAAAAVVVVASVGDDNAAQAAGVGACVVVDAVVTVVAVGVVVICVPPCGIGRSSGITAQASTSNVHAHLLEAHRVEDWHVGASKPWL